MSTSLCECTSKTPYSVLLRMRSPSSSALARER
jgi:hypothetical protein